MDKVILECKNINKKYRKKDHYHNASKNISFKLKEGECLGVVGESGCGKSTLAKIIMNLEKADSGEVILDNECISNKKGKELREVYKNIQMVFQDAIGSFNPKITIGKSIDEYVCSLCTTDENNRARLSIEKFTESYRKWCLRRNYKFRTNTAHKLPSLL